MTRGDVLRVEALVCVWHHRLWNVGTDSVLVLKRESTGDWTNLEVGLSLVACHHFEVHVLSIGVLSDLILGDEEVILLISLYCNVHAV